MRYSNSKPKIRDLICVKHHISTVSSGLVLRDFEKIYACLKPYDKHEHKDCLDKFFFVGSIGIIVDLEECDESNFIVYGGNSVIDREIVLKKDTWVRCFAHDYKESLQKLLWIRSKNVIVL
jgi:hypothetical protein